MKLPALVITNDHGAADIGSVVDAKAPSVELLMASAMSRALVMPNED
jgi:hypothetical protein